MSTVFWIYVTDRPNEFGRNPRPGDNAEPLNEEISAEDVEVLLAVVGQGHPILGQFIDFYDDHIFESEALPEFVKALRQLVPVDEAQVNVIRRLISFASIATDRGKTLYFLSQ